jgi:HEAT repeat protein
MTYVFGNILMATSQASSAQVTDLLTNLKSDDLAVRTAAWQSAGQAGPEAFQPLAELAATGSLEVGRAACRAMWQIVHSVGAPGGHGKQQACQQLVALLAADRTAGLRRDVLWMLSELSDGGSDVAVVAALLTDPQLREDARCVLQRLPGDEAVAALKAGFAAAPEEFKYALADSLRRRGQQVDGYASKKMVPVRQ